MKNVSAVKKNVLLNLKLVFFLLSFPKNKKKEISSYVFLIGDFIAC